MPLAEVALGLAGTTAAAEPSARRYKTGGSDRETKGGALPCGRAVSAMPSAV
jgi:hypothetical protein